MSSLYSVTYMDHNREKSTVSVAIPTVGALNFDSTIVLINALLAAAANIAGGVINNRVLSIPQAPSGAVPATEIAQREGKWLIGYTDTQAELAAGVANPLFGKRYTTSLAAADLAGNLSPNSDFADLDDGGVVAAFVTAFEAVARSPAGGTVEVNYIKHVGRNT